jgi:hypothetical protein
VPENRSREEILNRSKLILLALIALVSLLAFSCASTPYRQNESGVMKLVQLINEGKVTRIDGLSKAPFVLDTETLYLQNDVDTMWKNLKAASFVMSDARFVSTSPVTADSYKVFADTFDMKNYFAKYTGKDTSIVTVETREGTYYLLLDRKVKGYPRIQGLKGPVK